MQRLGIHEEDIEERFIRSSGKGGQKVNKTSTCVYLRHIPTAIKVKCQQERSQALNRFLARRILTNKIETLKLGRLSEERKRIEKIRRQKRKRSKRAKEKMLRLKAKRAEKKKLRSFRPHLDELINVLFFLLLITSPASAQESGYGWKDKETSHFHIYYRNANKKYVEKVKDKAEDYYWELEDKLGFLHTKWKGKIYIYDTKEDYVNYENAPDWSIGFAYLNQRAIISFSDCQAFLRETLPHELGHLVFNEFLEDSPAPLCIHEGIAQYVEETERRQYYMRTLKQTIRRGNFIALTELLEITSSQLYAMEDDAVNVFYAEALGLVEYLVRRHTKFNFSSFLRQIREGDDIKSSLRWAFSYDNILELNDEWLKYLK